MNKTNYQTKNNQTNKQTNNNQTNKQTSKQANKQTTHDKQQMLEENTTMTHTFLHTVARFPFTVSRSWARSLGLRPDRGVWRRNAI